MSERIKYFQDRQPAIDSFDALWNQDKPWILAYSGLSGNGKSTLLDWLEVNRCQAQHIPYALIGLGELATNLDAALYSLIEAPAIKSKISPPVLREYQYKRREALEDRHRRRIALTMSQTMQSSEGGEQTMNTGLVEAIREMDRQSDQLLGDLWLECISSLPAGQQVVFLLDNYDTFQDVISFEEVSFFWNLLGNAQARVAGLRVVMACREEIRHQNRLHVLQNGLCENEKELKELERDFSDALIRSLGVADPAFCQAVFDRLAHGHPLITKMATEAWRETPGGIPAGEVPQLVNREQAAEWVQGRILAQLTGGLKDAVRWSALLRWFNAESLISILGIELNKDEFWQLSRYSFITYPHRSPRAWACHDLVRRVQSAYLFNERPAEFKEFHRRAEAYYIQDNNLLEALYHHFFIDAGEAFETWKNLEDRAAFLFDHPMWSALIEIGLSEELVLGVEEQAEVFYRAGCRHYYRAEWIEASSFLHQALELYRAVGSRLGEANVLKAMGDVQNFRDERDAALESYTQALGLFRAVGSRLGEANVLKAMGDVQNFRKEMDAALESYTQALGLFRAVGDRLGEANVLQAMGDVQNFRDERDAALESYTQALGLFRAVGSRLGEANVLQAMGDVQNFRKEMDAALESYTQALGLFRAVGDRLGEANVLQAMGDVQNFRKEMDAALTSYSQALELYRAVGARLGEANVLKAIGATLIFSEDAAKREEGADCLQTALDLYRKIGDCVGQTNVLFFWANVVAQSGQLQDALPFAEAAYELGIKIDPDHPGVRTIKQFLDALKQQIASNQSG